MNKLAIQFRKFIGHKDFNLFREELFRFLATKALTEETEETYPFNAEMINQWNKFRKQEMVEKISLSNLARSFYFGWPPPLDEQHVPFYRDEVKAGDMQIIADLFRVSNRIESEERLLEKQETMRLLSSFLDGQSAAKFYHCIRNKTVYDRPWRGSFLKLFPQADTYLAPCSESESEFKKEQISEMKRQLSTLPIVNENIVYKEIYSNFIRVYEKLLFTDVVNFMFRIGPALTNQQIIEREKELEIQIPDELRQALLGFSGDVSIEWHLPAELKEKIAYKYGGILAWELMPYNVRSPDECGIPEEEDIDDYGWFKHLVLYSIGNGDTVVIGLEGEQLGKIYYCDHGLPEFFLIESSFTIFLLELSRRDFCNPDTLYWKKNDVPRSSLQAMPTNQLSLLP